MTAGNAKVRARASIDVMPRAEIADPQGQTVERALPQLGWTNVMGVRMGKHLELEVEGTSLDDIQEQVADMCERFLSNPVIESYRFSLDRLDG